MLLLTWVLKNVLMHPYETSNIISCRFMYIHTNSLTHMLCYNLNITVSYYKLIFSKANTLYNVLYDKAANSL